MGMFDSFHDSDGNEWQTKAFNCDLDHYRVGDELPYMGTETYQVEVLGGSHEPPFLDSYATIRDRRLESTNDERDETLPLMDYHGDWIVKEEA